MSTVTQSSAIADVEIARLVLQARQLGDFAVYVARRKSPRYKVSLSLEATLRPGDPESSWLMWTQNVSLGGITAWSDKPLSERDVIYVRDTSSEEVRPWLKCVVRHATKQVCDYLIGCEFQREAVPIPTSE